MSVIGNLRGSRQLTPVEGIIALSMLGGNPASTAKLGFGLPLATVVSAIGSALPCLCINEDNVGLYAATVSELVPSAMGSTFAPTVAKMLAQFIATIDPSDDGFGANIAFMRAAKMKGLATVCDNAAYELMVVDPTINDEALAIAMKVALVSVGTLYQTEGALAAVLTSVPEGIGTSISGVGDYLGLLGDGGEAVELSEAAGADLAAVLIGG